jgi:hypothetical protein
MKYMIKYNWDKYHLKYKSKVDDVLRIYIGNSDKINFFEIKIISYNLLFHFNTPIEIL